MIELVYEGPTPDNLTPQQLEAIEKHRQDVVARAANAVDSDTQRYAQMYKRHVGIQHRNPIQKDVRVPFHTDAWRNRRKTGEIVMHPYLISGATVTSGSATWLLEEQSWQSFPAVMHGKVYYYIALRRRFSVRTASVTAKEPSLPALVSRQMENDAINAALSQAHSGATDILVELAELPETLMLFKQLRATLTKMRELDRNMAKLRLRRDKALTRHEKAADDKFNAVFQRKFEREYQRALRQYNKAVKDYGKASKKQLNPFKKGSTAALLVDSWMLWRFGIRPLILSAVSIADDLDHKFRVYAGAFAPRSYSHDDQTVLDQNHYREVTITKIEQKTAGIARYRGKEPFRKNIQLLTANPYLAVWERIPYSWALDRFVHIGNVLSTLVKPGNLAELKGCVSTKVSIDQNTVLEGKTSSTTVGIAIGGRLFYRSVSTIAHMPSGNVASVKGSRFARRLQNGPSLPAFNHSTWHLAKAADLIGLLTQLTRR